MLLNGITFRHRIVPCIYSIWNFVSSIAYYLTHEHDLSEWIGYSLCVHTSLVTQMFTNSYSRFHKGNEGDTSIKIQNLTDIITE